MLGASSKNVRKGNTRKAKKKRVEWVTALVSLAERGGPGSISCDVNVVMQRLRILLGLNDGTERGRGGGACGKTTRCLTTGPHNGGGQGGVVMHRKIPKATPFEKMSNGENQMKGGGGTFGRGMGLFLLLRGVVLASTIVYTHECVEGGCTCFYEGDR